MKLPNTEEQLKLNPKDKRLAILLIVIFVVVVIPSIILIDWLDKNVMNPRIWKDWTCEKMIQFATKFEDEKLTDFQRAKFHEDLSLCMSK